VPRRSRSPDRRSRSPDRRSRSPDQFRIHREIWREAVELDGRLLKHAPEHIKGDREVVLAAMEAMEIAAATTIAAKDKAEEAAKNAEAARQAAEEQVARLVQEVGYHTTQYDEVAAENATLRTQIVQLQQQLAQLLQRMPLPTFGTSFGASFGIQVSAPPERHETDAARDPRMLTNGWGQPPGIAGALHKHFHGP
tara:strand:- start:147 stop:731 length:585 start_codon:yes stop_codon:yes gene_type:complete